MWYYVAGCVTKNDFMEDYLWVIRDKNRSQYFVVDPDNKDKLIAGPFDNFDSAMFWASDATKDSNNEWRVIK